MPVEIDKPLPGSRQRHLARSRHAQHSVEINAILVVERHCPLVHIAVRWRVPAHTWPREGED